MRKIASVTVLGILAPLASCAPHGRISVTEPAVADDADLLVLATRETSPRTKRHSIDMGPPPPGYVRVVGGSVPDWSPADMVDGRPGPSSPLTWSAAGPRPIREEFWSGDDDASGRIVGVAPHPDDPDICYIASASGGIWKTVDGGESWSPITDELSNLNHGAIALDPTDPDIVYAGTGEYTMLSAGDGVFRSLDAGLTWERIATRDDVGSQVSGIAVSPQDQDIIHVTGRRGYVRSVDGGATWTLGLGGRSSSLALHPTSPNRVFVAQQGVGIFRSVDGGEEFTPLTSGLPADGIARIVMSISQSNPSVLYAAFADGSGVEGLYRTENGGDTWTRIDDAPNFAFPQAWYDMYVAVDPTDEDIVFLGGVTPIYAVAGILRTENGGSSWTEISRGVDGSQTHPDHQFLAFGPDGTIWEANDGGIWKSVDGGDSWINCNATLAVTQHYDVAISPFSGVKVLGGTQDNGSVERVDDTQAWPQLIGGDGGALAWDHEDPDVRYTTYVRLDVQRWIGTVLTNISGPWGTEPRNFIAPLVMDPDDADTLLGGTNRVWRTRTASGAADWEPISTEDVAGSGTINVIAVRDDTIYTGSNTGAVWATEDDGTTWEDRSTGLPAGQVSDIEIDVDVPTTVYVSSYNAGGPRLHRSFDGGLLWEDLTHDLPPGVGITALAIDWRIEEPRIYIGTGAGVWSSDDAGITWIKDEGDLPNVNIGDLEVDTRHERIIAGTFGRGTWWAGLTTCLGDLNGDGAVAVGDLLIVLAAWDDKDEEIDLDGSGVVDIGDLLIILAAFGPC